MGRSLREILGAGGPLNDGAVNTALRHGLGPMLLREVEEAQDPVPAPLATSLRNHARQVVAQNLRNKRLLLAALDALGARGITPVVLKGFGLALRVYPDPLVRPSSDVDLLVAPSEVERAEQALRALDLAPKVESDDYYPPPYRHHLAYAGARGLVELHFRPISAHGAAWEAEAPLSRAQDVTIEGRAARWFAAEDELVFLALHATNHLLLRLGWLFDLRLLFERYPAMDLGEVERIARKEARMPALVFYALDAARRAVDAKVPPELLERLRPSGLRRAASELIFSQAALRDSPLQKSMALRGGAKLLLADSRARVVLFSLRRLRWDAELKLGLRQA